MARVVENRNAQGLWQENLEERGHLEEVSVVGRITLKGVLRKRVGRTFTGHVPLSKGITVRDLSKLL